MKLKNNYYRIIHVETDGLSGTFHIRLIPECEIYRGHFPDHAVCPGVCHIGVIQECASRLTGKPLSITFIKQCRFTAVASPSICPELDVIITIHLRDKDYHVTARMKDSQRTYAEYKGIMTEKKDKNEV